MAFGKQPERDSEIVPSGERKPAQPNELVVGAIDVLSLEGLTPEQQQFLRGQQAEKLLSVQEKAQSLAVSAQALNASLGTMATHVGTMTDQGVSAQVTQVRDDALGRTEVIIGNTEAAKSGKLSRSARGLSDNTYVILGFTLVVLLIGAAVVVKVFGGN